MHAFGVRSSFSQHFTSTNPGFLFMPPSFRKGVMGETSPVSLGGYGGVQRGPKGGIAKVPLAPLCKKQKLGNLSLSS